MLLENFDNYDYIRPLVSSLASELDKNDLLSCITALELLSEIASSCKKNAGYFNEIGLFDKAYDMFLKSKENPDEGLIHTGKFLSFYI